MDNQNNLVRMFKNQVVVSSVQLAEHFDKEHKNVLRLTSSLLSSSNSGRLSKHFFKSNYTDDKGEKRPMYLMDRDGFSLLVMSFKGEKALKWKLDFIDAFNAMEQEIKTNTNQLNANLKNQLDIISNELKNLKIQRHNFFIEYDEQNALLHEKQAELLRYKAFRDLIIAKQLDNDSDGLSYDDVDEIDNRIFGEID
ncbi:phage regulatory protein, rha family [Megamonas sp. Calf98-2]|uniref:Rha family transcriptional regulator n=1 Tax=Megamonas sp. Calf98-2 TaxID=1855330 RepID=UPI0008B72EA9|nr:Rha family transcriptional regulator [Megamonas sp. Calf98-2]SEN22043.1 phage regulatory protein, rha family [Megamonas sp. Calf98-2]